MDNKFVERMRLCSLIAGNVTALARMAGISQSGIRKYMLGAEPTRPVLIALSEAVNVSLLWLVSGCGPLCEPDSSLLSSAKKEVVKDFLASRQSHELLGLRSVEAQNKYCENYNVGIHSAQLPDWVQYLLPKVSEFELARWEQGDVSSRFPDSGSKISDEASMIGWLQAPVEIVVAVAREFQKVLGDARMTMDPKKEGYVLNSVVNFICKLSEDEREKFINPGSLLPQIMLASHIFDQDHRFKAKP